MSIIPFKFNRFYINNYMDKFVGIINEIFKNTDRVPTKSI